jgi:hypothetical protein
MPHAFRQRAALFMSVRKAWNYILAFAIRLALEPALHESRMLWRKIQPHCFGQTEHYIQVL